MSDGIPVETWARQLGEENATLRAELAAEKAAHEVTKTELVAFQQRHAMVSKGAYVALVDERDEAIEKLAAIETALAREVERRETDKALHPNGRCVCGGEGACQWCKNIEHQERAEAAEKELTEAQMNYRIAKGQRDGLALTLSDSEKSAAVMREALVAVSNVLRDSSPSIIAGYRGPVLALADAALETSAGVGWKSPEVVAQVVEAVFDLGGRYTAHVWAKFGDGLRPDRAKFMAEALALLKGAKP